MGKFQQGLHDDGPVRAGTQVIVVQDGRPINYAREARISKDNQIEDVLVLGHYGAIELKSLGYSASIDLSSYLLQGEDVDGSLSVAGWQTDGSNNINSGGLNDFAMIDLETFQVLETAIKCKPNTENTAYPQRGLITRDLNFKSFRVLPGIQAS